MKPLIITVLMMNFIVVVAQQKTISRKELLKTALDQKVKSTEIQEITMAAGQGAPEHLHPCPVLGIINSGEAVFQIEGKEKVVLHEGDAFYEPKNVKILHFDNASAEKPLVFTAIYLKEGNEENIKFIK
ncbi:quercetin dioxygenase-like cupin family protein [Chryseobacterium bernardetii]|jgi:quercetin dioxygenase-like cupin family protein|uniref:Quercetin dioxygenase-like cupin family protein n=2 Tax=Chryseobacterium TaxID=59732 RepID=A0A543EK76_9FLAO|nr:MULTISPECIES: cupin domain-containing protein [Chryseobacterium]MDR6370377.1 quercetin dioxygenase-like cupin family protein [Chryseobacterium vietnamense]MDR6440379.1 quercetin dioxygenase-like cupin family protein [Chryseobacterium bernardetii]MDR6487061.1 quercetin dioxygenase-like cupin family protein [Chryseobacterium vietnamense]TQM21991.1 quercetin dioxygenase-like cupin family protein [Chryseobacterium aquifrigidense]